jgi:hypothetical protein
MKLESMANLCRLIVKVHYFNDPGKALHSQGE